MKLRIIDDLGPEDLAMLQALYSRSPESVDVHLDKVKSTGSGKFMEKYYVGYSHKSIADCGTTTMFIEGVSLLAAKAIQDWPLYSGQETSTRYIDMSKQRIVDPVGTPESKAILDAWMSFYKENQGRVAETIMQRYPRRPDEKPELYERAVKARTFDTLRGFLPAGITTQLSWHTNLRQAGDHLSWLLGHPSIEIAAAARELRDLLAMRYKSSGFDRDMAAVSGISNKDAQASTARANWEMQIAQQFTYSAMHGLPSGFEMTLITTNGRPLELLVGARNAALDPYMEMLKTRPRGCVLPHFMADLGQFTLESLLDFGSFRDLQRHRNGVCRMPLLSTDYGFERWYLDQLNEDGRENMRGDLRDQAVDLIRAQTDRIQAISPDPVVRQYYTALGFRVPCQVTYALPAFLYVLELRSGKMVHPTLRRLMHSAVHMFQKIHPDIALHADLDPDDWDVRRGTQTILERK